MLNAILCTYMCTYTYCTYMDIHAHICAHLESSSSRCICPFLMRVFKSRHQATFLPFCKSTIESSSIQFEKNGQGHGKVLKSRFQFSALYPVDSLQANLISYLSCSRDENAKYTLEFSFQICRTPCTHCTPERHGKQNCPPQL